MTSFQILEYHSRISSFLSTPQDYGRNDKFLPWSFGTNKIEVFEIEQSSLQYWYKNNPFYIQLNIPQIEYVQNTQKNVSNFMPVNQNKAVLMIKNQVYI